MVEGGEGERGREKQKSEREGKTKKGKGVRERNVQEGGEKESTKGRGDLRCDIRNLWSHLVPENEHGENQINQIYHTFSCV